MHFVDCSVGAAQLTMRVMLTQAYFYSLVTELIVPPVPACFSHCSQSSAAIAFDFRGVLESFP